MQDARSDEEQRDANVNPIRPSGSDVGPGPPTATWLLEGFTRLMLACLDWQVRCPAQHPGGAADHGDPQSLHRMAESDTIDDLRLGAA
jgi:hypothetical protein